MSKRLEMRTKEHSRGCKDQDVDCDQVSYFAWIESAEFAQDVGDDELQRCPREVEGHLPRVVTADKHQRAVIVSSSSKTARGSARLTGSATHG